MKSIVQFGVVEIILAAIWGKVEIHGSKIESCILSMFSNGSEEVEALYVQPICRNRLCLHKRFSDMSSRRDNLAVLVIPATCVFRNHYFASMGQ